MARPKTLLVLLHGFTFDGASLTPVRDAITAALEAQGQEVVPFAPDLPLTLFSRASPVKVAEDVANAITEKVAADGPIARIILVGHSTGALLARKVYVIACGETRKPDGSMSRAPFEAEIETRDGLAWAPLVERIVLLAGLNRGWRVTHHLGLVKAAGWSLGLVAAALLRPFGRGAFLITRIRAGTEFISNLRIQWLRMRRRFAQETGAETLTTIPGGATVVQLLGSIDDFVSPRDNVDLVTGSDFIYLDVPYSSHTSIIDLDDAETPPGAKLANGAVRSDAIVCAATAPEAEVRARDVRPWDPNEGAVRNEEVKQVIFVVHGIRDGGYWTEKIARAVVRQSPDAKLIATETSSYGYFPMLSFLFSFRRREKAEWLMDQYTEALACYPNALETHFVGHSNGTYCLGDALQRYSCCHFDNVVLAGSVLRTRFPWRRIMTASRSDEDAKRYGSVKRLLNIVATSDLVVAGFPNLFDGLGPIQQLGGAGHKGFRTDAPGVQELHYARGGHGAGIAEPLWPTIGAFVLGAPAPRQPASRFAEKRNWLAILLGIFPAIVWIAAVFAVLLIGNLIYRAASGLACRLGDAADQCLATLPSYGASLNPLNWSLLPPGPVTWIVPIAVLLYVLGVIKLLRWV